MREWRNTAIAIVGAGFIAFQLYVIWGFPGVVPQRVIHVCFALTVIYLMKPLEKEQIFCRHYSGNNLRNG